MKRWCLSDSVRLWCLVSILGCLSAVAIQPVWAGIKPIGEKHEVQSQENFQPLLARKIRQLSEIERPSTSAQMLVQSPAPQTAPSSEVVQVTGVKANPTDKGVEVILQTTVGEQLQITNRSTGNSFIADIPNAQLSLPSGEAFTFRSDKPVAGITEITVINFDANTIRVTVTGEAGVPTVELFDSPDEGLIFGITTATTSAQQPQQQNPTPPAAPLPLPRGGEGSPQPETPSAEGDEPIELVVTGEQDGYRVRDSSTATKTDTPLRDIPQSIQVVPQQVLRDQQVNRLEDALRNVSGITPATGIYGLLNTFNIRGFSTAEGNILRDGLRDSNSGGIIELPNIERVEVLRGPASVLYGYGNPGGTINLVTKQPLREPFYFIDATIGNYDFYRGAIDLSGPLNNSKNVLYRLNAAYTSSGSFIDFFDSDYLGISPILNFAIGKRTNLTLEGEYVDTNNEWYAGVPAIGTVLPNSNGEIPRTRNYGEPSDYIDQSVSRIGYRLEHQFSDNWSLRNAFRVTFIRYTDNITIPISLRSDNRTLNRLYREYDTGNFDDYVLTTDLVGKFSTGSIEHQLLVGVDLGRYSTRIAINSAAAAPLDLFDPVYNRPLLNPLTRSSDLNNIRDSLGIYVQDQVTLAENLKLLLGLRFDAFEQRNENLLRDTKINQSGDAFSPRLGIVYQPLPPISLYASYARSFTPTIGNAFDGSVFQPERGTQYEVGVKADLNDQLSATLAFYNLTRSNVLTTDPLNPGFSIQRGEQRSRGIELNVGGEILPGWNIFAGYAYTDAQITKDEDDRLADNLLNNVPEHAFNLWTTYQIQKGDLQGLGFGLGFFFVGERQGDLANTFEVPSYLRTDVAIFYTREQFRVALNFKNLFDVEYFENAFNNVRLFSGQPFTLQGTLSWQF
ncbi:TonB-dependent siderophore receptor [Chlorogloeopsis sp. ULAP01]|uniref:TonB-dependent siderophore receptor n=1 Tax=Chlorogloeopsis sp. ULAP01 TaxID=3056483 RepID=UPI0025AB137D|nr:TonB-dependent siderophore receptor [Chlorogloeopsis sp. ULAP01]MDM9382159.1 TonB-dependent siderophore receptor [Chlorogloeopsis sp. ULAP01]